MDLLSARLDGAGDLTSVDPAAVLAEVEERGGRPGAELLRRLGADLTVSGSVVGLGGSVELRATLSRPDGRPLQQAHVTAQREEGLSRALGELALELLTGILEGEASSLDYGAAQETQSLQALKAYLRGEAAFRTFRLEEATEAFQEAVALDTAFALAYFKLNRLGDWLEDGELVSALDRALTHRDRLPRRQQRILGAHVEFWRSSVSRGIQMLEEAVAAYPADSDAWYQLGDARFHGGPRLGRSIMEAEEPFRRALELNPRDHRAALHLVGLAAYRGDSAEAARLARLFPGTDVARRFQVTALSLPSEAPFATLAAALATLPLSNMNAILSVADFLECPELLFQAGRRLEVEGGTGAQRLQGLSLQLLGAEAAGWTEEVEGALERLAAESPAQARAFRSYLASFPWRPLPEGWAPVIAVTAMASAPDMLSERLLALKAGMTPRLDSLVSRLEETPIPPAQTIAPFLLRAEALLLDGRPEEALAVLDDARRTRNSLTSFATLMTMPHAGERFLRARILEAAGRAEEALAWYGTMAAPVTYSLPYAAPAHLARARILTALGRREEAQAAMSRAARITAPPSTTS